MMRHGSPGAGRDRPRLRLLGLAILVLVAAHSGDALASDGPDNAFVVDHCASCHDAASKKGRLDLTALAFAPNDPANLSIWIKVHDRVRAGEMPPKEDNGVSFLKIPINAL